ncbi:hypothetical protein FHT82_002077 [Rhizobium sp. BK275]|uniref:hypothetical protein n=1 Tax=unclassified Rhizobium TaxID=2613769 RepID=UPI0016109A58|nr:MULTISPECIES: hypothetical protein [unclassified Rhizobium]MBB3389337.1 hypothetical protein [Rhizobium sp. BK275]MBB3410490.1 hypothetical protein [Rhizobium sp. BK316]
MQKRINIQQNFVSDLRDSIQSAIQALSVANASARQQQARTSSERPGIGLSLT